MKLPKTWRRSGEAGEEGRKGIKINRVGRGRQRETRNPVAEVNMKDHTGKHSRGRDGRV